VPDCNKDAVQEEREKGKNYEEKRKKKDKKF
jgi:hypothetical protein